MQLETGVLFSGQVKPMGISHGMNWKTGSVHIDHDVASGAWMAKLYFKVNPNKAYQQIKIKQSDTLEVKSGRLIIENKKGEGIHIRLSGSNVNDAKLLVSKIKNSMTSLPARNKAEVGLTSNASLTSHKGSENVNPKKRNDSDDLSLLHTISEISPKYSQEWLSKKTPPLRSKEHDLSSKRKLELLSPERDSQGKESRQENDNRNEQQLSSSQNFTGMKDYSKRNLNGGNSLHTTPGLGAKNFYGSHNSLSTNSDFRNTHLNNSSRHLDRSPSLKRQKLSTAVSLTNHNNRMVDSRLPQTTSPSADTLEANDSSMSLENSVHNVETPRRHLRSGETIGFQNLGNTCFLNSPLQCLSSLEPLSLDIQSAIAEYGKELNPNSMTRKLYLLMKDVRKLDVCPDRVKEILIRLRTDMNVKFAPNTQQDAHEFLSELLNQVDEEVKAAIRLHSSTRSQDTTDLAASGLDGANASSRSGDQKETSAAVTPVSESTYVSTPTEANFCWFYRTCIYFHECKTEVISSQTECEMTLMLALDSSTRNLQDCIKKYFESTEVEMKCEKCGRDEKATITRKIVRRPRIFILNLLRYHSDNVESTKKTDHISVPSYITVCEYCADDVKKPPHVDPVFMLDRIGASKYASDKSLVVADVDKQENIPPLTSLLPTTNGHVRINQADIKSLSHKANQLVSGVGEILSALVDYLRSNLCSVDKYVENAQENGEDISALCEGAQTIISELNATITSRTSPATPETSQACNNSRGSHSSGSLHELYLSGALVKRVLNVENSKFEFSTDVLKNIIDELIMSRYDYTRECKKNMNHLIENLGLCVSAIQCGILKPEGLCQITTEQLQTLLGKCQTHKDIKSKIILQSDLRNSTGESCADNKVDSDDEESDVQFKKVVTFKNDVSHLIDEDDFVESDNCSVNRDYGKSHLYNKKSSPSQCDENLWNDNSWGEEDSKAQAKKVSQETSLLTGGLYNSPDANSQLLQGKDISFYTEDDLQNIDCASLTEDEMMVFAQALSRFTYEKEQAANTEKVSADTDINMDICHSFDYPQDDTEDTSGRIESLRATSESDCFLKDPYASSVEGDVEISGTSSLTDSVKTNKSRISTPLETTTLGISFSNFNSHHKSQVESCETNLLCQEGLNGHNESDRGGFYSGPGHKTFKTSGQTSNKSQHDVVASLNSSAPVKHSVPSGKVCSRQYMSSGSLDQTDLDSQPFKTTLSSLQTNTRLCDAPNQLKPESSPLKANKLNTSPKDNKSEASAEHSLVKSKIKSAERNGDHVVPQYSHSVHKKEILPSPSKSNNLIRTRDYARLKSPAASPKKKTPKGQQSKSASVSKRLNFTGEDKVRQSHKFSPEGERSVSHGDVGSAELKNTSLEVNIADTSYLENSSFMSPSSLSMSYHSTPKSTITSKCLTNSTNESWSNTSNGKNVLIDYKDTSVHTSGSRKVNASEKRRENTQLEHSPGTRLKMNRSLTTSFSNSEEKENMPTDLDRATHLQNIENDKADLSYKLVGVVDHTGTSQFTGHYTAYAFNMRKQKWFYLNDSETEMVTEAEVQKKNSQTGYLFFYMDKDLFDEYRNKVNTSSPWKSSN